jgi:hypothetical protein
VYAGKELYDSIDGAADRFFQYGFRKQYVVRYSSADPEKTITVEVYDIGTPDDAFGIFSCHDSVMAEHTDVGLAATVSDMNLDFCEGKYFVRLMGMGFAGKEARNALRAFAETIAGNVRPAGRLPELVSRLPQGYAEGSLLFFHTWQTLNERRYVADENVFNLDEKNHRTNGVVATYSVSEIESEGQTFKVEKDVVYLIEYPDEKAAAAARTRCLELFDKLVADPRAEGKPPGERLERKDISEEPTQAFQLYKGEGEKRQLVAELRAFRNTLFGLWEIADAAKSERLLDALEANVKRWLGKGE